jgi:hypothetical protein
MEFEPLRRRWICEICHYAPFVEGELPPMSREPLLVRGKALPRLIDVQVQQDRRDLWETLGSPDVEKEEAPAGERAADQDIGGIATSRASEWMSPKQLADAVGKTAREIESWLRRFRKKNPWCCEEVKHRKPNESKFMFRREEVLPTLKEHFLTHG